MNHSQEEEGIVPLSLLLQRLNSAFKTTFPGSSGIQQHITNIPMGVTNTA